MNQSRRLLVSGSLILGVSIFLSAITLTVQADSPEIVHDASEPIFRVTAKDAKDMLKSVPGILKDLGQSAEAKGASQIVGTGVGKTVHGWTR
jgi:hypothetical protein